MLTSHQPVVVTDGTTTYTTTISIATFTTTTSVTFEPTVIKRRLGGADPNLATGAEALGRSTVQMTATLTQTEYEGTATGEVGQGGVRTIELVPGEGA